MEKIDNKYEVGDWLIYPKHGLGKAIDYEVQTILKKKTEFLVVFFEQERMTLRIPIDKMNELGLRSISGKDEMKKAMIALKGKARIRKTMWAKREKDYRRIHAQSCCGHRGRSGPQRFVPTYRTHGGDDDGGHERLRLRKARQWQTKGNCDGGAFPSPTADEGVESRRKRWVVCLISKSWHQTSPAQNKASFWECLPGARGECDGHVAGPRGLAFEYCFSHRAAARRAGRSPSAVV